MTKKILKLNPTKRAIYWAPPPLMGGIFFYGKIGSGKTVGIMSLAGVYHNFRKYKIFDLWGGKRNEHYYWCIPSRDDKYWESMKKKLKLNVDGKKQYKVNLFFPNSKTLPDKLPYLENFIFPRVFTIPFKDIELDDIRLVLGNLSPTSETLFSEIKDKMKDTDGSAKLIKFFEDLGGVNDSIYKNFFYPLIKQGVISSNICEYNIDFKGEAKDKEIITNLSLEFVDQKFKLFFIGYFLRNVAELLDVGKIPLRNIMIIREAQEFFRATEKAIVEDRYKIFKSQLSDYIRMARRGMHLLIEAQSPSETRGMVDGSQDFTVLGKIPGRADREEATEQMRKDGKISMEQIRDLGELEQGQYYILEAGKFAKKKYLFLPRCMYWKEGYGSFFNIWKNIKGIGAFESISHVKLKIKEEFQFSLQEIKEKDRQIKELKKQEKEMKEEEKERKKEMKLLESERRKLEIKRIAREEEKVKKKIIKEQTNKEKRNLNEVEVINISPKKIGEKTDKKEFKAEDFYDIV